MVLFLSTKNSFLIEFLNLIFCDSLINLSKSNLSSLPIILYDFKDFNDLEDLRCFIFSIYLYEFNSNGSFIYFYIL
ncbi:hypothetical protein COY87_03720 [Candidatus Roizmanbacteria bacterium CG_4_10_14_0_8_um_filter_33_9]|uniref:Uncharacterized protein n=1 Tax=Candidatus Roizmanbacteria bacterium CG_4_10_14_0_8_um_filter_33_9 TaxID=1974826 RepID=A0A2M7QHW0_9BACT|nr:MAG: hypothetical protein COY87_03720 [Candidatus Roizmanbacteria bacterium CG_4_10_14_0_8_um_filter_33_9]